SPADPRGMRRLLLVVLVAAAAAFSAPGAAASDRDVEAVIVLWTAQIDADAARLTKTGSSTTLTQLRSIGATLETHSDSARHVLATKQPVTTGVRAAKADALHAFSLFAAAGHGIVLAVDA